MEAQFSSANQMHDHYASLEKEAAARLAQSKAHEAARQERDRIEAMRIEEKDRVEALRHRQNRTLSIVSILITTISLIVEIL